MSLVEDESSEYTYEASTDTECFSLTRSIFEEIIGSKKQEYIKKAYTGEHVLCVLLLLLLLLLY
jgi:hypothetical protein